MPWLSGHSINFSKITMQYFLICCFVFLPSLGFSQDAKPDNFSKIHFVYDVKSNYHIDDNGVFADTVLMKLDFPTIKYSLRRSPMDAKKIVGFVRLTDFDEESKHILSSTIYHTVERIEGTYDLKRNKTTLRITRNDDHTRTIFRKFFKQDYEKFKYTISIDYSDKKWICKYPHITYKYQFDEIARTIDFANERKMEGSFSEKAGALVYHNLVYCSDQLNSKVTPDEMFSNNEFGVEKIISIYKTINLESVVYE